MTQVNFVIDGDTLAVLTFLKVETPSGNKLLMPFFGAWREIPAHFRGKSIPYFFTGSSGDHLLTSKYYVAGVEVTPELVKKFWEWHDLEVLPLKTFQWWSKQGCPVRWPAKTAEQVRPLIQKMFDAWCQDGTFKPETVQLEDIKEVDI